MRNIISYPTTKIPLKTLVFILSIFFSNSLFAAKNNLAAVTKNTPISYQGISTATFESLSFYPKRSAPAKVEAINTSKIPAEISAKIKQILVKPGVVVKAGETLAKLECNDYQYKLITTSSILNQSQQQLSYETKELKRAIKVAHKSSLSKSEVERRQTLVNNLKFSIDANKANQSIAEKNVNRCTISAPFKGIVSKRIANVGEMLAAGAPILELVQLNNSEVSATISISNLDAFYDAAEFNFILQNRSYPLKLRTIFNFIANNSSSQNARFLFTQESATIGSTGRLLWRAPRLHLPAYLLSKRGGDDGVFIVKDGKAVFVIVKNAEEGRPFIVDLKKHQKVILEGRHALTINQKLHYKNANKKGKTE